MLSCPGRCRHRGLPSDGRCRGRLRGFKADGREVLAHTGALRSGAACARRCRPTQLEANRTARVEGSSGGLQHTGVSGAAADDPAALGAAGLRCDGCGARDHNAPRKDWATSWAAATMEAPITSGPRLLLPPSRAQCCLHCVCALAGQGRAAPRRLPANATCRRRGLHLRHLPVPARRLRRPLRPPACRRASETSRDAADRLSHFLPGEEGLQRELQATSSMNRLLPCGRGPRSAVVHMRARPVGETGSRTNAEVRAARGSPTPLSARSGRTRARARTGLG